MASFPSSHTILGYENGFIPDDSFPGSIFDLEDSYSLCSAQENAVRLMDGGLGVFPGVLSSMESTGEAFSLWPATHQLEFATEAQPRAARHCKQAAEPCSPELPLLRQALKADHKNSRDRQRLAEKDINSRQRRRMKNRVAARKSRDRKKGISTLTTSDDN